MKPTIRDVESAVCRHFKLTPADMRGHSRFRRYARPRQIAMFLALDITGNGPSAVGRYFNRDHSTASHARDAVPRIAGTKPKLADNLRACREAVWAICRERAMIARPWTAPLCEAPETARRVFVVAPTMSGKQQPEKLSTGPLTVATE